MFWIELSILAIVGGIIGWVTNIMAIKLIFRPLKPFNIPMTNIKIQGLIPKRQAELAKSIGQIVESELVSIEEIIAKFLHEQNKSEILVKIRGKIKKVVEQKLPFIIPSTFKALILNYIDEVIDQEAETIFNELAETIIHKAATEIKIAQIIEEKIINFELDRLEIIIIAIAKKELKHIELLGGLIGFLIGILQGFILLLT